MTRVQPRARLHSSELLRFLASQGLVEASADTGDVGLRLGDWLHLRHAIALQGLMGQVDKPEAMPAQPTARVDATVLRQRFAQVRTALEQFITDGCAPAPGMARIEQPDIELAHPIDPKTAFDPFRRFALGHQRQMEQVIKGLRAQLRGMLEKGPPAQRQLAALDAIFENVLMDREGRLLGQIPLGFETRFAKALKQHIKELLQATAADEPAPRTAPWLAPLLEDLRSALLAELDLRLQPVLGLIEALAQDTPPQP
jgi:Protein of unknown function (DUF3348)